MKKNKQTKLKLNRETVQTLGTDALYNAVNGGGFTELCETVFGPRCNDTQGSAAC